MSELKLEQESKFQLQFEIKKQNKYLLKVVQVQGGGGQNDNPRMTNEAEGVTLEWLQGGKGIEVDVAVTKSQKPLISRIMIKAEKR